MAPSKVVRVAVVQAEPAWLDLVASVVKTCRLIDEAAANKAEIIAFPEVWIPGYPCWVWSRPVDFEMNVRYIKNSLRLESPEMDAICASAAQNAISVVLGFSENDGDSLYIAQAIIGPDGKIRTSRRKMKPTHMERTVFGDADGRVFNTVAELPVGRVGALSCWEHMQPLLKFHTYSQREQIHVAAWPVLEPHPGGPGLWSMSAEGCQNLSRTYAIEGQTYVLHATTVITQAGIDLLKTAAGPLMAVPGGGFAAVFGPDGRKVSSSGDDLDPAAEGIVYADLDLDENVRLKMFADPVGHYSRPDLMWLGTNQEVRRMVNVSGAKAEDVMSPPPMSPTPRQ